MAAGKELRTKIKSVENTKKITKAMEMISVSKMRKAQDRMRSARPYSEKVRNIAANLGQAHPEYVHPFMRINANAGAVGFILVSTDKGLCGALNTNLFRALTAQLRDEQAGGKSLQSVAIGSKGLGFLTRVGARVVSQVTQLGDKPHLDRIIGPIKVLLDAYAAGELSAVYLAYNRFVSTMKQDPVIERLLPLSSVDLKAQSDASEAASGTTHGWDYIYEPDAQTVIDELLVRYVEALVYQAVAENTASEHAARMVAMKAATDNAGNVINELKLVYNKTRQAAITKELSEIVAGAAAV